MVTVTPNSDVPQQPLNFDNSYLPDQLIAGVFPRVTLNVTVLSGSVVNSVTPLPRGTVLGKITTSGKYIPSLAGASDGSQNPVAILVDVCDPSGGDVNAGVYLSGEFNSNAITFDSSWTVATLTPKLQTVSCYLKNAVSAADPTNE